MSNAIAAGRPPVLDEFQRGRICGMVSLGASRREVAKAVGCHVSTIARTADRDGAFARQLADAETLAHLRPLKALMEASSRHWRAAAWLLERMHPEQFGRRAPWTYTRRQVRETVDQLLEVVLGKLPPEQQSEIQDAADRLVEAVGEPKNELVEIEKMFEGLNEYKRQGQKPETTSSYDSATNSSR